MIEYGKYVLIGMFLGYCVNTYTIADEALKPVKTSLSGYDLIRANIRRQYQCEALNCLKQPVLGLDFKRFETIVKDLEE